MNKLTLLEIKQALWDERFRNLFPEYKEEIEKSMQNKTCSCGADICRKISKHTDRLQKYFPTKVFEEEKSNWKVINCHVDELESKLRKIKGTSNIAVARWQDQVTVIIANTLI